MEREIKTYEQIVENYSNENSNIVFDNKGSDHAAIVVAKMIERAKKSIRIYTGSFDKSVVDNDKVLKALRDKLQQSINIEMLVEDMPIDKNKSNALKLILDTAEINNNIQVKILGDDYFAKTNIGHFMVVDDIAYRYEIDMDNFKAICSFNDDSQIANKLIALFDKAFISPQAILYDKRFF